MAVFTELEEREILEVVDRFGVGDLVSYDGVEAGSRSTVYELNTTAGRWILRLIETERFEREVRDELGFVRHLHREGLPVPRVKSRSDGGGDTLPLGDGEVSLFSMVRGEKVSERPELAARLAEPLGEVVARMHQLGLGKSLRRRRALTFEAMRPVVDRLRPTLSGRAEAHMPEIDQAASRIVASAFEALPRGVLHNDLFTDNVFVDGGTVSGIIDFGECLDGPLVHDLAVVFNQWGFDERTGTYCEAFVESVLRGYQRIRVLEPAEVSALPAALDRAALTFIYVRLVLFEREADGARGERKDFRDLLPMLRVDKGRFPALAAGTRPGVHRA